MRLKRKASLCSKMSTSSNLIPVIFNNFLTVGIGADITLLDSTPDVAYSTILAKIGQPSLFAFSSEAINTAEAPSET